MSSLLLDQTTWDLVLDINGNIAVCADPYTTAQEVANACRTFQGECYYDTSLGVPYFQDILGKNPPIEVLQNDFQSQALLVPTVSSANVIIAGYTDSQVIGQIQITDINGSSINVSL